MNTFDIYAYFDNRQVYAIVMCRAIIFDLQWQENNGSYVETSSVYSANI